MFRNKIIQVSDTEIDLYEAPSDKQVVTYTLYFYNSSPASDDLNLSFYDNSEGNTTEFLSRSIDANSTYTFPGKLNLNYGDKISASSSYGNIIAVCSVFVNDDSGSQNSFNPRGNYDSEYTYDTLDVVYHPDTKTSYVCPEDNVSDVEPPDSPWIKLLEVGDDANNIRGIEIDDSSPEDGDTLVYDSDQNKLIWDTVEGGAGSGLPLLIAKNMDLDDTDTGASRGKAFDIIQTINFNSDEDGASWVSFHFPDTLDETKDVNLKLFYVLDGEDDDTNIEFLTEYWTYNDNDTPDSLTSDGTNVISIDVKADEYEQRLSTSLPSIPSSDLSLNNTITLKFTRLGSDSNDTYNGTLKMMYIFHSQE